ANNNVVITFFISCSCKFGCVAIRSLDDRSKFEDSITRSITLAGLRLDRSQVISMRGEKPADCRLLPKLYPIGKEVVVLLRSVDYFLTASVLRQQSTAGSVSLNGLTAVLRP